MDKFLIKGIQKIKGTITASGAKNAGLPIMAATILASGKHIIKNVPDLIDIRTMAKLLRIIGAQVNFENNTLKIITNGCDNHSAPYDLVKTMRASIYVLGPLLARKGEAKVSFPGGCALGARPIDLHLKAFEKLGAKFEVKHGYICGKTEKLIGANIFFETKSVGATANVLMAAVTAQGKTLLQNAACEPEITSLAKVLNSMGANITGLGTEILEIQGVEKLYPMKTTLIPDRIETGSLLIAAAITRGSITVENCNPDHLGIVLEKFENAGFQITTTKDSISLSSKGDKSSLEITTNPYPGFPTDLQPQFAALLSTISGKSSIYETIFPDRFMYTTELQRLGADIKLSGNEIIIRGGNKLSGAPLMASDIRAAAALVLAALVSSGETEVSRIYHLDRGYENFENKLTNLGANIKRVQ
ncbi:MAG: UDP-N-acetylglucosamine 1-carboxyvinyltransferase [Candidatus Cloacimonadota bacterium]|nr:UDP-N-acetylglucosamine 1-carboxyvinyltransferase [Candidatus Cloacimonadota bacterium]